jgi:hypothetical protein
LAEALGKRDGQVVVVWRIQPVIPDEHVQTLDLVDQ